MFPVGEEVPLDGATAVEHISGELSERIRGAGIASAVAAPIKVVGRLWAAVVE